MLLRTGAWRFEARRRRGDPARAIELDEASLERLEHEAFMPVERRHPGFRAVGALPVPDEGQGPAAGGAGHRRAGAARRAAHHRGPGAAGHARRPRRHGDRGGAAGAGGAAARGRDRAAARAAGQDPREQRRGAAAAGWRGADPGLEPGAGGDLRAAPGPGHRPPPGRGLPAARGAPDRARGGRRAAAGREPDLPAGHGQPAGAARDGQPRDLAGRTGTRGTGRPGS